MGSFQDRSANISKRKDMFSPYEPSPNAKKGKGEHYNNLSAISFILLIHCNIFT